VGWGSRSAHSLAGTTCPPGRRLPRACAALASEASGHPGRASPSGSGGEDCCHARASFSPAVPSTCPEHRSPTVPTDNSGPSGEALSWRRRSTRVNRAPGRASQARDAGPRWVRTVSETAGRRRARAVTVGESESQVIPHSPASTADLGGELAWRRVRTPQPPPRTPVIYLGSHFGRLAGVRPGSGAERFLAGSSGRSLAQGSGSILQEPARVQSAGEVRGNPLLDPASAGRRTRSIPPGAAGDEVTILASSSKYRSRSTPGAVRSSRRRLRAEYSDP
jgi:hypothetical protein